MAFQGKLRYHNRNVLGNCKGALGTCYLCGRLVGYTPFGMMASLEWHHVLKEILDRKHSKKYGLKVRHAIVREQGVSIRISRYTGR